MLIDKLLELNWERGPFTFQGSLKEAIADIVLLDLGLKMVEKTVDAGRCGECRHPKSITHWEVQLCEKREA